MRSLILTILVLVALVAAFMVFMFMQGDSSAPVTAQTTQTPEQSAEPPANPATQTTSELGIGAGEDTWVQTFDKDTGELVSEFRLAHYNPPKDGIFEVSKPEIRFFQRNGQVLLISAVDGRLVFPEQQKKSQRMGDIDGKPPTRGTLNRVTLEVFETIDSMSPILTSTIPVLAFDNDAMRLNTVQTEIDGKIVPADRVPVIVRGRDYDFDGAGLTMSWNPRDQRLEQLQIAHGQRLVVKSAKAFDSVPIGALRDADGPIMLASAESDAAAAAAAAAKERKRRRAATMAAAAATKAEPEKPRIPVAYQAVFADGITIHESSVQIGQASTMTALFTFDQDSSSPATQAVAPTTHRAPRTTPRPPAPESKPKKPAGPVEIRWSGPLTVTPMKYADSGLRSAEDRIIRFDGAPVHIEREGSLIEASRVEVGSVGDRFIARSSEQFKTITVSDPSGMKLVTSSIEMSDGVATVAGNSVAVLPVTAGDQKGEPLSARWKDKGTLRIASNSEGVRSIESALFEGAVDVQHPQIKLNCDRLALALAPGKGTEPQLKGVDAEGAVRAVIKAENGDTQTIGAKKLVLSAETLPDGRSAFRTLNASGDVVLQDPKQKLSADKVEATFTPIVADDKSKQDIKIEKLAAEGHISFLSEAGARAAADVMTLETRDGVQELSLHGSPASIGDKQSQVSGKLIKLDPEGTRASVVGSGLLIGIARSEKGDGTPVEVRWTDSFQFIAAENRAEAIGQVTVKSRGTDGAEETATGGRLKVTLADATGDDATKGAGMGKKVARSIELSEAVEISSILTGEDSKLLRRVHLFAPSVSVGLESDGAIGPVSIPSAGRLLFEDQRRDAPAQPNEVGMRGAVAVSWSKSMQYDPLLNQATIDGDIVVVHQQADTDPLRMNTQQLVADFANGGKQAQQLKRVRAAKGASFVSKQLRFDAAEAEYDPVNDRVIARGTERQPVEIFDEAGLSSGSFQELWWNLKTNRPERMKNVAGAVRR